MPLLSGNMALTSREWAITALVFQGRTNAQIAAEIQTTEHIVETHLRRIVDKTGCWNRTEIALWYLKIGVVKERRFYDRREANWEISGEHRESHAVLFWFQVDKILSIGKASGICAVIRTADLTGTLRNFRE